MEGFVIEDQSTYLIPLPLDVHERRPGVWGPRGPFLLVSKTMNDGKCIVYP